MGKIDVLVVGAGPTGLLMAAEAARYGLSCRIIDREIKPTDQSRALVIHARTMELFDHLGIATWFLEEGLIVKAANPMSRHERIAHVSLSQIDSPYPFVLSLEQSKTEAILTRYLKTFGIEIERGVELLQLDSFPTHITAKISGEEIEASWIVGCDGAHSFVRKSFHLSFQGKLFSDIFSLADVQIDWKYPHDELYAFLNPQGVMAAIPMPGHKRYRLIFQLPRCRNKLKKAYGVVKDEEIAPPSLEEAQGMIRAYGDEQAIVSHPVWMAHFHVNSRLANRYREGRAFLAGDAAHIHSPVGGQGMNTGLQDVFNLAWKMAAVHQGKAPDSLLDTYHLERYTFGKQLLEGTEFATRLTALRSSWSVTLRNFVMKKLLAYPAIQKKFLRVLSQIAIQYPESAIVKEGRGFEGGPRAGTRAPNAPLLIKGTPTDLYTLWRGSKTEQVLLFSGLNPSQETLRKLEALSTPSFPLIRDRLAHEIYGTREPALYRIRPDGYIGSREKL